MSYQLPADDDPDQDITGDKQAVRSGLASVVNNIPDTDEEDYIVAQNGAVSFGDHTDVQSANA